MLGNDDDDDDEDDDDDDDDDDDSIIQTMTSVPAKRIFVSMSMIKL